MPFASSRCRIERMPPRSLRQDLAEEVADEDDDAYAMDPAALEVRRERLPMA